MYVIEAWAGRTGLKSDSLRFTNWRFDVDRVSVNRRNNCSRKVIRVMDESV
jgi:hypothetical protein